jgi:hypothetical protein
LPVFGRVTGIGSIITYPFGSLTWAVIITADRKDGEEVPRLVMRLSANFFLLFIFFNKI